MFKKKRLSMVRITLKHGDSDVTGTNVLKPDIVEEIAILPGQSVHLRIGCIEIREGGQPVRTIDAKAGYTVDVEYFYN